MIKKQTLIIIVVLFLFFSTTLAGLLLIYQKDIGEYGLRKEYILLMDFLFLEEISAQDHDFYIKDSIMNHRYSSFKYLMRKRKPLLQSCFQYGINCFSADFFDGFHWIMENYQLKLIDSRYPKYFQKLLEIALADPVKFERLEFYLQNLEKAGSKEFENALYTLTGYWLNANEVRIFQPAGSPKSLSDIRTLHMDFDVITTLSPDQEMVKRTLILSAVKTLWGLSFKPKISDYKKILFLARKIQAKPLVELFENGQKNER